MDNKNKIIQSLTEALSLLLASQEETPTIDRTQEWIPLSEFMKITNTNKRILQYRVFKRQWHDGFVVKKSGRDYTHGCLSHYEKWKKEIKGKWGKNR